MTEASEKNYSLVKIHSHPGGGREFSVLDNESDEKLFPSIHGWIDTAVSHASVIMLLDSSMVEREVHQRGKFNHLQHINVASDDLSFWFNEKRLKEVPEHGLRVTREKSGG